MLDDLLTALAAAHDASSTWLATQSYLARLGFDKSFYAFGDWDRSRIAPGIAFTSITDSWTAAHFKTLSPETDPMLAHACNQFAPLPMGVSYAGNLKAVPREQHFFMSRLADCGMRSIRTFPVRLRGDGPFGGWALSQDNASASAFDQLVAANGREARLAAFIGHERMQGFWSFVSPRPLTAREADCLLWLARGFRLGEIANRLGISLATVEFHLRHAREKLGARTREEALAKALVQNLICP